MSSYVFIFKVNINKTENVNIFKEISFLLRVANDTYQQKKKTFEL